MKSITFSKVGEKSIAAQALLELNALHPNPYQPI